MQRGLPKSDSISNPKIKNVATDTNRKGRLTLGPQPPRAQFCWEPGHRQSHQLVTFNPLHPEAAARKSQTSSHTCRCPKAARSKPKDNGSQTADQASSCSRSHTARFPHSLSRLPPVGSSLLATSRLALPD